MLRFAAYYTRARSGRESQLFENDSPDRSRYTRAGQLPLPGFGVWPDPTFDGIHTRHFRAPQRSWARPIQSRIERQLAIVRQLFACARCGGDGHLYAIVMRRRPTIDLPFSGLVGFRVGDVVVCCRRRQCLELVRQDQDTCGRVRG